MGPGAGRLHSACRAQCEAEKCRAKPAPLLGHMDVGLRQGPDPATTTQSPNPCLASLAHASRGPSVRAAGCVGRQAAGEGHFILVGVMRISWFSPFEPQPHAHPCSLPLPSRQLLGTPWDGIPSGATPGCPGTSQRHAQSSRPGPERGPQGADLTRWDSHEPTLPAASWRAAGARVSQQRGPLPEGHRQSS
ncbi:pyrroline-5-carboxylate reductase [Platysternon megacephalum]|uniref:Pyrroline-5-carboxylate reductase n=1 Tax=Platysternon megacephalum TaxID=55544 RepID=A0A4D9DIJ5_9SAUR|nr:pyrroline-5-carboxylate reductase [Platysternon megacephalum]